MKFRVRQFAIQASVNKHAPSAVNIWLYDGTNWSDLGSFAIAYAAIPGQGILTLPSLQNTWGIKLTTWLNQSGYSEVQAYGPIIQSIEWYNYQRF